MRSLSLLLVMLFGVAALVPVLGEDPATKEPAKEEVKTYARPVLIKVRGEINSTFASYLQRKMAIAKGLKPDLLLIELDSPGGRLDLSEQLANEIRSFPAEKTVVYVRHEAVSGGTYLSLGCDEIIMHPEARLGDVGVIFMDEDFLYKYAPEKFASVLIQQLRVLADAKGRPAALAEAMVDKDVEVFRCKEQSTGKIVYRTNKELESAANPDDFVDRQLVIESQKGRFLTVSGKRAVELELAQGVANSLEECQARYRVSGPWRVLEQSWVDRTIEILRGPWITLLLLLLGIVGIGYEAAAPGTMVGGLVGTLCFGLFFVSRFMAGTSGWLEVVLFAAALALLAAELFVLPGFGIAGVVGLTLLLVSIVLACQAYVIPQTSQEMAATGQSLGMAVGAIAIAMVGMVVATYFMGTIPFLGHLVLDAKPAATSPVEDASRMPAWEALVGQEGVTQTPLRPLGLIKIGSVNYDAATEGDFVGKGEKVRVIRAEEHKLVVEVVA